MVNYQTSKIYKICSYQTNEIYIGSTTQILCKRIAGHRVSYKRYKKGKADYMTSFKILAFDDAYIELLELFPCDSKEELHKREGEEIRACECVNKIIPGRTKKEYHADNRESILAKMKQHYKDNKESISANKKQHYKDNKESISAKRKVKIECDLCYSLVRRGDIKRHQRSKKCKSKGITLE